MPGVSWKDLKKSSPPVQTLDQAAQLSPVLANLLAQREKLEAEMQSLSQGGADSSSHDGARIFPVQTLADRRKEIQRWETLKEIQKEKHKETLKETLKNTLPTEQRPSKKPLEKSKERIRSALNEPLSKAVAEVLPKPSRYSEFKERVLSVEVGSLNDIAKRLDQQRQAALDKRIEQRTLERNDARRRECALSHRRKRQSEQELSS